MCGRKTLSKDITSIIEEMNIEEWEAHDYKPNYNIAPTNFSPVIINDGVKKTKMMRWGLVPSWSKNRPNWFENDQCQIRNNFRKAFIL